MAEFKERIRKLRKEHHMKQGELAKVLNYGYTAISNYESGRNEPSIKDMIKIADYFAVSMDYLVGRTNIQECLYLKDFAIENEKLLRKLESLEELELEMKNVLDDLRRQCIQ